MFHAGRESFAPSEAVFDPLEAAAVRLGAADPLRSLSERGSRIGRLLFGERRQRLANDRLEALRRLTVMLRQSHAPSAGQLIAARRAGVSETQIRTLWSLVRGDDVANCCLA